MAKSGRSRWMTRHAVAGEQPNSGARPDAVGKHLRCRAQTLKHADPDPAVCLCLVPLPGVQHNHRDRGDLCERFAAVLHRGYCFAPLNARNCDQYLLETYIRPAATTTPTSKTSRKRTVRRTWLPTPSSRGRTTGRPSPGRATSPRWARGR